MVPALEGRGPTSKSKRCAIHVQRHEPTYMSVREVGRFPPTHSPVPSSRHRTERLERRGRSYGVTAGLGVVIAMRCAALVLVCAILTADW